MLNILPSNGEELEFSDSPLVTPIAYSKHSINQSDIDAVIECLANAPITQGTLVPKFEQSISKKIGWRRATLLGPRASTAFRGTIWFQKPRKV